MKRLLLLAGIPLALFSPSPSIANGWVRNPTNLESIAAMRQGLWQIIDRTDPQGDTIGTSLASPLAVSPVGLASIRARCGSSQTSVLVILREENFIAFDADSLLAAKVDGVRYNLSVEHETWEEEFDMGEAGHLLFRRAIREELPVKIAVPIYQKQDAFFEWTIKGGAAAWKEACPPR